MAELISSGDFEENLVPNLLNIAGMISQVYDTVVEKEKQNSPDNILSVIFVYM